MTVNDIIGKWDFNFWLEENKSNILTIYPNGEASTGVTFYKYEICGEKLHLFVEDYVDYWGSLINGTLKGTAESYSNAWHWSATKHIDPIIEAIPEKRLFDSNWVIINNTDELDDNKLSFQKDGVLKSNLYGIGSWKYVDKDLIIITANGFIQYQIKKIDGEYEAIATNKVGQKWNLTPKISLIPKPLPKPPIQADKLFKDLPERYFSVLKENGIQYLYHFTDRKNLAKIKEAGGLYSWHFLESKGIIIPRPGGDDLSRSLDKKFGLQDYVRLSFCKRHPMSFRLINEGADIVYLKISLEPVILKDTLFTDMNATDKLHHQGGTLNDLKMVKFDCTKLDYAESMEKKYKQAEVMVKTFLPIKYILNINEI